MDDPTHHNSGVDEVTWRAWIEKGSRREKATAQKARVFGGAVLVLLSLAAYFYAFWLA